METDRNTSDNEYTVMTGEDIGEDILRGIMDIDRETYDECYVGDADNMIERFRAEKRSFVCLKKNDELIGYINFFPVTDLLWDEIVTAGKRIRDDDITAQEIYPFSTPDGQSGEGYNLFILSVVILEKYRCKQAVMCLTEGFIDCINRLEEDGYRINAIAGAAISEDGMKFMRERMFYFKREVTGLSGDDETDRIFVCDGDFLESFREKKGFHYKKNYEDDLYMIIPFSSGDGGFRHLPEGYDSVPKDEMTQDLMNFLNEDLRYELASDVVKGIKHYYLGECDFLYSFDEYPQFDDDRESPAYFFSEERARLILMADEENRLYNLLIFIHDSRFSPSQALDQVSQNFIPVRNLSGGDITRMDGDPQSAVTPEELIHGRPDREQKKTIRAFYREKYPDIPKEETEKLAADMKPNVEYYDLLELMNYKYGILPCGEGKLLLCASDKPAEDDLACILAGETYLSMHQDFRIKPDHFGVDDDKSVYDYYRVYESERAVVFIPNERLFDRKPGESDEDRRKREHDRIDLVTTFTFIMEMATFRNTSLRMISEKISAAILQGGDVSYSYLKDIYRDLANTGKYADRFKFKYYGTQLEAAHIIEAFRTGELEEEYLKQKEFLESYIELYNASRGKLTSSAVSIAAAAVSIISIKDFFADMISQIALKTGVPILDPSNMFYEMLFAVMLLYILTRYILFRKEASDREKNLIETYKARFTFLERFRPDNEINEKPDGKDRQNEEG